jgi:hypothetical protein
MIATHQLFIETYQTILFCWIQNPSLLLLILVWLDFSILIRRSIPYLLVPMDTLPHLKLFLLNRHWWEGIREIPIIICSGYYTKRSVRSSFVTSNTKNCHTKYMYHCNSGIFLLTFESKILTFNEIHVSRILSRKRSLWQVLRFLCWSCEILACT